MVANNNSEKKQQQGTEKLRTFGRTNVRYTISLRFLSFVALVALLSGGVVGLVIVSNSRTYLRQQALQNNLNQANLAAAFASNYIKAIEAHVQVFASRPDVRQAVLNGTPQQLQETLAAFVLIQTPLNGVGIYDASGIQLTYSVAGSTTIGQSFADRNWFQGAMAAGEPYLGTPILAKANNVPVETYAVPIRDEQGQIRAVLSAGISLQKLSDSVVSIGFGSGTHASMIDIRNGGLTIADKASTFLLKPVNGDKEAVIRLLAGQGGALETADSNGKPDLTAFAPVADLPWGIMVVTPRDEAFTIINSLSRRASIYAGLIILASAILGGVFVLQITRPIRRLVEATREIGRGNLDFKVDTTEKNEIGDLSRAFSEMTVKLKNTMVSRDELAAEVAERKQAEEFMRQSEEKYRKLFENAEVGMYRSLLNGTAFVDINKKLCEIFGYTREEMMANPATMRWKSPTARQEMVRQLREKSELADYEVEIITKSGTVKTLVTSIRLYPKDGYLEGSAIDITERKLAEKALRESEERYRILFESAIDGILIADLATSQFKYANPSICKILGYTKEELTKLSVMDIHPPESLEDTLAAFGALARGEIKMVTVPCLRKDGTIIFVNISAIQAIIDGKECNVGFFNDVTESKRAEESLQASETRYRRLFEAARDGILILNAETGTVVDVNPFMIEMLGFSRVEFLGKKIWELGFLKDIVANKDNFEELKRQKYIKYENLALETAVGQRIQVEFVSHLYEVGNQQVIQCNIRDITERKRLEQEKEKFTRELAEKNTELERFTYTVSHDLKSPLVTVKTFLGYLKQDMAAADAGRIEKDLLFINGAADKMNILLGELLEMSRIGRVVNPPAEVTFKELAEEAERIVAGPILEGKVQVRLIDEPVTLYGDRSRLLEIWQNLVENAVKFMGTQPAPQIEIGVEHHDSETVFFVRDNGIGIKPQYHSKLFNIFEKINPRTEGTGMGLAITKRIVELYKGRIWVESKGLEQGTSFFFTLPGALKDKEKDV